MYALIFDSGNSMFRSNPRLNRIQLMKETKHLYPEMDSKCLVSFFLHDIIDLSMGDYVIMD